MTQALEQRVTRLEEEVEELKRGMKMLLQISGAPTGPPPSDQGPPEGPTDLPPSDTSPEPLGGPTHPPPAG